MSTSPEKDHKSERPVNKATMDQPQEEFIEPQSAHLEEEESPKMNTEHTRPPSPTPKKAPSQ